MENMSEEELVVDGISKDEAFSYWSRSPCGHRQEVSSVLILLTATSFKPRYL
jgi:hypothetical protein